MTVSGVRGAAGREQQAGEVSDYRLDPRAVVGAGWDASSESPTPDWIPWCREHDELLVATSRPVTTALRLSVLDSTGQPSVEFLYADPQQICDAQAQLRVWLAHEAAEGFAEATPNFSAKEGIWRRQAVLPALAGILIVAGAILDWRVLVVVLFGLGSVSFLISSGYKVAATFLSPVRRFQERRIAGSAGRWRRGSAVAAVDKDDLGEDAVPLGTADSRQEAGPPELAGESMVEDQMPVYSILVPVFHEAAVVASIMRSFLRLDYPREKLDVLILLEEDDVETIQAARAADPPRWMRLIIVPAGEPRTKPRACNVGLLLCRGEYVVIYDAEDRPEPDQLRKALVSFRHDSGRQGQLACVQASLNFYNPDYNLLTRMFAIEYAQWFDFMLVGLAGTRMPLPLGGTSNHFKRSALAEVGGWDPYNVTEDADLGIRLTASGYRVDVINSTTWEEATPQVMAWIRQRTRWIKGYLVTAAVNLRHPASWARHNGGRAVVTMAGLIVGTPANFLLYPVTLAFTLCAWLLGPLVQIRLPHGLLVLGMINLVLMNLLMIITSGIAGWRRYNWRIGIFAIFLPVYWLLHAAAAWRAVFQLIFDPHRWEKTPHGLGEDYQDSMVDNHGLAHTARR